MNDKIGKMGSAWVWLFALGAVLFGMGSGYVTAGMSAKISSGVYFGVFIVSGFAAMALTQAKAWLGIAAFLLAALVSAAGYYWIAAQAGLVPPGERGRTRQLQLLAFLSTEVQKPYVRSLFASDESEKVEIRATLVKRFNWLGEQKQGEYLLGAEFCAADAFAYGMLRWAALDGIELPTSLTALARRVERRTSVAMVLAIEDEAPLFAA